MRSRARYGWIIAFIAVIFLANYSIRHWGTECFGDVCVVPVAPGIDAPSGVLWIGLAFTLRDLIQRTSGVFVAWLAVLGGAGLSALLDPSLALASGAAFFLSESLDLLVYTPLQRRSLPVAVVASNIVGLVVDSFVFLTLAGIPLAFMDGQIIGKLYMTALALPVILYLRNRHAVYDHA